MKFRLTKRGKENIASYIRELEEKRERLLKSGADTADETVLPSEEDILSDAEAFGLSWDDPEGPCYYNGWGVTDSHEADRPILLILGRDIVMKAEGEEEKPAVKVYILKRHYRHKKTFAAHEDAGIDIFADKEDAVVQVKKEAEAFAGCSWDSIPASEWNKGRNLSPEHMYLENNTIYFYWNIEERDFVRERNIPDRTR